MILKLTPVRSDIHDTLLYAPGNAIYPDSLDSGRSQHVHALAQQAFKVLGELNESKAYETFEVYIRTEETSTPTAPGFDASPRREDLG